MLVFMLNDLPLIQSIKDISSISPHVEILDIPL
jgi:hypothetical protein